MSIVGWATGILQTISDTPIAQAVRSSEWLFPTFETVHVVAIVIVVGSITRLDLRMIGLDWTNRPITEVSNEMLPFTWMAFVVALIFGALLWSSKPFKYLDVAFFDVKMVLIVLAGINMLYFQFVTFKTVAQWDRDPVPPAAVRIAGAVSLGLWIGVVVCGRFIGFVSV